MATTKTEGLVPASVALNIAKRIRDVAAMIARAKNVPLRSKNQIGIPKPKVTQGLVEVTLTLPSGKNSPLAAYEWGSGLHATQRGNKSKGYVLIQARNAPELVFIGTNAWRGKVIRTQAVFHPGVKARPFIAPARVATREENNKEIKEAVGKSIRLQLKAMSRKV